MRFYAQLIYCTLIISSYYHQLSFKPCVSKSSSLLKMSLSRCLPEKVENLHLEYETYNFERNWDKCDYIDPCNLPEHVGKNDLLIVQWNTRGLRGKLDDIENLLNNTLEQKVGIVIINESWVTNNSRPLPKINGYKYIGKARGNRRGWCWVPSAR